MSNHSFIDVAALFISNLLDAVNLNVDGRGGSRPVYKVCTNLSDFLPEKFFLECFCKVQMIPDFMGSEFALQ